LKSIDKAAARTWSIWGLCTITADVLVSCGAYKKTLQLTGGLGGLVGSDGTERTKRRRRSSCSPGMDLTCSWIFEVNDVSEFNTIKIGGPQGASLAVPGPAGTKAANILSAMEIEIPLGSIVAVTGGLQSEGYAKGVMVDRSILFSLLSGRLRATEGHVKVAPHLKTVFIDESHLHMLNDTVEANLLSQCEDPAAVRDRHGMIEGACQAVSLDPYLTENRAVFGTGFLGSAIRAKDRAAIAIATAILTDADILLLHEIDRQYDDAQRKALFSSLNEHWVRTGGSFTGRCVPRTVFMTCCDTRIPESATHVIRIGTGPDGTGVQVVQR